MIVETLEICAIVIVRDLSMLIFMVGWVLPLIPLFAFGAMTLLMPFVLTYEPKAEEFENKDILRLWVSTGLLSAVLIGVLFCIGSVGAAMNEKLLLIYPHGNLSLSWITLIFIVIVLIGLAIKFVNKAMFEPTPLIVTYYDIEPDEKETDDEERKTV